MSSWKLMMTFVLLVSTLSSPFAFAGSEYGSGYTVGRIYTSGTIMVVAVSPSLTVGTCNYFGSQLAFDASTTQGKLVAALIMIAKTSGKTIDVWYNDSSVVGTTQANGCYPGTVNTGTMSVLSNVSLTN